MKKVVIGVFDDNKWLEHAVAELNEAGIEEQVYDRQIVSQEVGGSFSPSVYAVSNVVSVNQNATGVDMHMVMMAFEAHLRKLHIPPESIAGYLYNFNHDGKFVCARVAKDQVGDALDILKRNHATVANAHA